MRLTENEKRDALKLIEQGKPLPEKYRFLLFKDDREVELVWNGKTDEVTNSVLPFQTIEHIDEPRSEENRKAQRELFDASGHKIKGWTNKLIWGDNKLILSSLKNGPLRKEIEAQGGLKLIYIDPPFDVGADFSMDIEIGDEQFKKQPSIIEEVAFRDTWGNGADSFIAMIYERLKIMHDLLSENGSIYVHCDWRVSAYLRLVLNEIFGSENYISEIIWKRSDSHNDSSAIGAIDDRIMLYKKSSEYIFNKQYLPMSDEVIDAWYKKDKDGKLFKLENTAAPGGRGPVYNWHGVTRAWRYTKENMEKLDKEGKLYHTKNGYPKKIVYLEESKGVPLNSIWSDLRLVNRTSNERLGYPTQKPESLLERIITLSSNEGDLIADFFCGSGTTLSTAEKLGRRWIGSDLGRFAIHTTRKRMIGVQRELKKDNKDFRAFEILNLGNYERDALLGMTSSDERSEIKKKVIKQKEEEYVRLILSAYKSEEISGFKAITGKKRDRLVAVGPLNAPVTTGFVNGVLDECKEKSISKVDVLGFDFEMGLDFTGMQKYGVDLQFRTIPREVFDKRAIEKDEVKFYDVAYIDFSTSVKKNSISVELKDFSVFYNQDDTVEVENNLKPGGSKVVIRNGQVIKLFKDKKTDLVEQTVLTKQWSDWIDYWAVDFDFTSKKEMIVVQKSQNDELEVWTGNYIFENEWQSFRTKKNRKLEFVTPFQEVTKGKRKIAVKVVDIFGNDTTKVVEVTI